MTLTGDLLDWYGGAARDLPWRRPAAGPWGVLVSEVMLQQTPVARVVPVYEAWLGRWPAPSQLAADSRGEAVRMWGRLGYPRRALRLHECAVVITTDHAGEVPRDLAALLELPGVGAYTARAVAAFGYGQRHAVVDTNVGRVAARLLTGAAAPGSTGDLGRPALTTRAARPGLAGDLGRPASTTRAARPGSAARDRSLVETLLPADAATAARLSAALMELGALLCTARAPRCGGCPVARYCKWRAAGYPEPAGPSRPAPGYAGTDRQVRGLLLAVLRGTRSPVPPSALDAVWPDAEQRGRALDTLIHDGLVRRLTDGTYALPS